MHGLRDRTARHAPRDLGRADSVVTTFGAHFRSYDACAISEGGVRLPDTWATAHHAVRAASCVRAVAVGFGLLRVLVSAECIGIDGLQDVEGHVL